MSLPARRGTSRGRVKALERLEELLHRLAAARGGHRPRLWAAAERQAVLAGIRSSPPGPREAGAYPPR